MSIEAVGGSVRAAIRNDSEETVFFGPVYQVEAWRQGGWVEIEVLERDELWAAVEKVLEPDETYRQELDASLFASGRYRISKSAKAADGRLIVLSAVLEREASD